MSSESVDTPTISRLIRLIEEYIPIQQIWVDAAAGDETQSQPFESAASRELLAMIQMLYRAYIHSGLSHDDAMGQLASAEAFGERYELIEGAIQAIKGETCA